MASVALDGTRLGTADGLTHPGTWLVSPRYDLAFLILSAVLVVFPHLFTLATGALYFLVLGAVVRLGAFQTGGPFRMLFFGQVDAGQHFFAFYSVILSFLLIHYYFDHFIFLQRDRVITPSFARP